MVDFEKFIIKRITEFRMRMGMTQKDIGQIIKVSPSFIGNIENAKSSAKYSIKHVSMLASYFNIRPVYFFVSDSEYIKLEPPGTLKDLFALSRLRK